MFNHSKNSDVTSQKESEVKEHVSHFVNNAKDSITDVASDVKASAANLGNKVLEKSKETKDEAYHLIDSLKSLLAQYADSSRATEIKDQIVDKAVALKSTVQDEVDHAYQLGKERATQTVQDKPILSLAVALGAGILLGYILGTKQSSNKD